ncbi:MAG: alpha-mannosidase [Lentisphaeria bacterium]|nr:alpha-mannosidase [Lentisphaeria bacterium]
MRQEEMKLYLDRCRRFLRRCEPDLLSETIIPAAEFAHSREPVRWADRLKLEYRPVKPGDDWGEAWDSAWFHLTAALPEAWAGKPVAMQLNLSGESLIFDADGVPAFALTGNSVINAHYTKEYCQFPPKFLKGGKLDLYVEAAANSLFGVFMDEEPHRLIEKPEGCFPGKVKAMRIGLFNTELWHMRIELELLLNYYETLPEDDYRRRKLLAAMNETVNIYADNPANAAAARKPLAKMLALPALGSALKASLVGHAHIDTGWLWPVSETIRKCARTFANQLDMIEKYPGYVFGASQPQHYAFVKEHYPELYEKIRQRVADGSWELQGGMWVEADCNLISGESMVRQFLHGKNFYMDEFGFDVKNLWIPDVFGYSAALPQIIRKSGCDFFLTQKISWNQFNRFPHNTFFWEGIDGSEVLTHFPPEDTYNAFVMPTELCGAQNRFKESDQLDEFISLFGIGDGGGGPKEEHIERALLLGNMEGMPKAKFGRADKFFERLAESDAVKNHKLCRWVGELYLEMHRGTLTTQARTKRNNRKLEQLLAATEFLCSMAPLGEYPAAELDRAWKTLLINQFHDIIPGSSIGRVYEVTEKQHAELFEVCAKLIARAAESVTVADADALTLVNTVSTPYTNVIELPEDWTDCEVSDSNGNAVEVQGRRAIGTVPASGTAVWKRGAKCASAVSESASLVLENLLIRYEFDARGELVRAFDKETGRETLRPGENGNVFSLYVDRPNTYEAWDVDLFYEQEERTGTELVSHSKQTTGSVESVMSFEWKVGAASLIRQTVRLAANSKRLDFETEVDWHECRRMLRVNFPVAVQTSEAAFEIQYGYAKRPTHSNTSWDMAKFEVVGHRYVDFSSANYGVAMLTDCKYGYRTNQGNLDLCLLRSPKYPDWNADQGRQVFTYAYLPHTGSLTESNVWSEAVQLNRAPLQFAGRRATVAAPFSVCGGSVSLEVVKKAEKSGELVIRLVETAGAASRATLSTTLEGVKLVETNLVEWEELGSCEFRNGSVSLDFRPFDIRTFKVRSVR